MTSAYAIRWIRAGIGGDLCASIFYPVVLFVPLTLTVAALFGPAIGIGSLGLRHLIMLHRTSVVATRAAIANIAAVAMLTAMQPIAVVQLIRNAQN